jgi:hypothetical protein
MSTTGEKYPTAASTSAETPWDDAAWQDPTNIYSNNATDSACILAASKQSQVLKAYGFDFSGVPDGAVITGVICSINVYRAAAAISLSLLQLLDASSAKVGTNHVSTPVALSETTSTVITEGSSTDTWGNDLTSTWVKDPDFGVAICVTCGAGSGSAAYIDYVTLEIYYTNVTTLTCDSGSYSITGTAASLKTTAKLPCGVGSYSIIGTVANLRMGYRLIAGIGSYGIEWGAPITAYVTIWTKKVIQTSYWAVSSLVSTTWNKISDLTSGWVKSSANTTTWTTKSKNTTNWTKE